MTRHTMQGWALLIVGGVIVIALLGVASLLVGVTLTSPPALAFLGVLAALGIGIGALWRSGRTRWAWALLLGGPGLLLLAGVGLMVYALAQYASGSGGF